MKNWKRIALMFAASLALVLLLHPAQAAGGSYGAFTYELKGNGTAVITNFSWSEHSGGDVYVPRMIDGYTVTEIGPRAFTGKGTLVTAKYETVTSEPISLEVTVILPDTITSINNEAFMGTKISNCHIPASVQFIGSGAFAGCVNIRQFSVSSGNPTFAVIDGVLYNKKIKELIAFPPDYPNKAVIIPDGIKSIAPYAFYFVGSVTTAAINEVTFPASLTEIKNNAFEGAELRFNGDLTHIKTIGDYAFYSADISKTATATSFAPQRIGKGAFSHYDGISISYTELTDLGADAFKRFELQTNSRLAYNQFFDLSTAKITLIPSSAFHNIGNPLGQDVYVKLPEQITEIGASAFYCIRGLHINIPANVQLIGTRAFYDCYEFDLSFAEGSSLHTIEAEAFREVCFINNTITLPEGLISIGDGAFYTTDKKSKLTTLVIPSSVTYIGKDVVDRGTVSLQVDPGSYAEFWALENGFPIVTADDTSWLFE